MTDELIEDLFDIKLFPQSDSVHRARALRKEPELVQRLQDFNFPGVFLDELCVVVDWLRSENIREVDGEGVIEARLKRIAQLVGDLNHELDGLQNKTLSLSLYMTQPDDHSKFKQVRTKVPVSVETLSVLCALKIDLSNLRAAALFEIKSMQDQRGGKAPTKEPVQKGKAFFVGYVAKLAKHYTEIVPGRNKDFTKVCAAVFACAGVTTKPDGAIKEYLLSVKPVAAPPPAGVTIHKIR